jgi:hypothetical protein
MYNKTISSDAAHPRLNHAKDFWLCPQQNTIFVATEQSLMKQKLSQLQQKVPETITANKQVYADLLEDVMQAIEAIK